MRKRNWARIGRKAMLAVMEISGVAAIARAAFLVSLFCGWAVTGMLLIAAAVILASEKGGGVD